MGISEQDYIKSNYFIFDLENIADQCYAKTKIDKMQQDRKCRLYGDRDRSINHIVSKHSKLAPKQYKNRHVCVGKVIQRELCKSFKFDHTIKWYMQRPEYVMENETHNIIWEFVSQIDHLMLVRTLSCGFFRSVDHWVTIKGNEKRDKYSDLRDDEGNGDASWNWRAWNGLQILV